MPAGYDVGRRTVIMGKYSHLCSILLLVSITAGSLVVASDTVTTGEGVILPLNGNGQEHVVPPQQGAAPTVAAGEPGVTAAAGGGNTPSNSNRIWDDHYWMFMIVLIIVGICLITLLLCCSVMRCCRRSKKLSSDEECPDDGDKPAKRPKKKHEVHEPLINATPIMETSAAPPQRPMKEDTPASHAAPPTDDENGWIIPLDQLSKDELEQPEVQTSKL